MKVLQRFFNKKKAYISELDLFLSAARKKFSVSASQLEEIKKHQKIKEKQEIATEE